MFGYNYSYQQYQFNASERQQKSQKAEFAKQGRVPDLPTRM